jgi:hypothetical protein
VSALDMVSYSSRWIGEKRAAVLLPAAGRGKVL